MALELDSFFNFFLFLLGEGADSGGARRPAQQFRDSDAGNIRFFLILIFCFLMIENKSKASKLVCFFVFVLDALQVRD